MRKTFAIAVLGAAGILAQPPLPRAQVEVSSLKIHAGDGRGPEMRGSPGGFSLRNASLRDMIRAAYGVWDFQILAGPDWIDSDRYDIETKAHIIPPSQMHVVVVEAVLRDRFKLKLHRETTELPVYVLTVAKGGARMRPSKDGSCVPFDGKTIPRRNVPGQKPYCGFANRGISLWLNRTIDAVGLSIADPPGPKPELPVVLSLTGFLSSNLDRMVIDKTGLTGKYDIHLEWNWQATKDSGSAAVSADDGPSLFTAVQDQLGLKLEPGQGPVEVLVVDHVERPGGN